MAEPGSAGGFDASQALRLYESMLYDVVYDALPSLLSRFVGTGGFIGVYDVISSAARKVFEPLARMARVESLRDAARLMRAMAEVHNRFGEGLVETVPRLVVRIESDHEAVVECEGVGYRGSNHELVPVVMAGLVGGFLAALGFRVKPLRSIESLRFLRDGEIGVVAEGDGRRCRVRVVAKQG